MAGFQVVDLAGHAPVQIGLWRAVCPGHLGPLTGGEVVPLLEAAAGGVSPGRP